MYCMLSQSSPQSHSCLECDATNGLDYHFNGGDEDKAAQNLCPEVQGMLQVSTCTWLRGSSQGVRRLVMVCSLSLFIQNHYKDNRDVLSPLWVQDPHQGGHGGGGRRGEHTLPASQPEAVQSPRSQGKLSFSSLQKLVIFLSCLLYFHNIDFTVVCCPRYFHIWILSGEYWGSKGLSPSTCK